MRLLIMSAILLGSIYAQADYTEVKNGIRYACTEEAQACEPQTRESACVNGSKTITVIACNGSTSRFSEACENEKVYSCDSCSDTYSSIRWAYVRLINGYSNGGGSVSGFKSFDDCMAARDRDNWCQGRK
jgi:hypothetical protein